MSGKAARILVSFFSGALAVGLGISPASAAAPGVTCGATVARSTTLTADLNCRKGDGVVLATGVVLDLGGHTLTGNSSGTGVVFSPTGPSTIKNGKVSNWRTGFDATADSSGNDQAIDRVTFTSAPGTVWGQRLVVTSATLDRSHVDVISGSLTASRSTFLDSSVGGSQSSLELSHSTLTRSSFGSFDGYGVSIDSSVADGAGYPYPLTGCGDFEGGVWITNSTVKNFAKPITAGDLCTVELTGNSFADNQTGVLAVSRNYVDVTVRNNTFARNGIAITGTQGMKISGNKFSGNATGVLVNGADTDSVVSGNVFLGNSSSGIRSAATGLTVGKNRAVNNGGYGIYAPNAKDLGGNVASGNARGNCVGLTCPTS